MVFPSCGRPAFKSPQLRFSHPAIGLCEAQDQAAPAKPVKRVQIIWRIPANLAQGRQVRTNGRHTKRKRLGQG
jgi:hypothetical protein